MSKLKNNINFYPLQFSDLEFKKFDPNTCWKGVQNSKKIEEHNLKHIPVFARSKKIIFDHYSFKDMSHFLKEFNNSSESIRKKIDSYDNVTKNKLNVNLQKFLNN
tara:strand:- start:7786 stop:8100 length:315 start_codon:yes stop_codon:yes gene_type:complete